MQEIRRAALAWYANLSAEKKQLARKFFNEMDRNRDGKISLQEYMDYLKKNDKKVFTHPTIFRALDKNGNGSLDFEEAITLYYIWHSGRVVICKSCVSFLVGVYFSCVQCFCRDSGSTYDLCCACYGGKKFRHHHDAIFCDNYTLLRQTRSIVQKAPAERVSQAFANIAAMGSLTFNAANFAFNVATTACSIM